jgi:DNA-binding NtrC family response regulator
MKIFKIKYLGPEKQREVFGKIFLRDVEQKHSDAGLSARCVSLKCFSVVESFEEIEKPNPKIPAIIMTGKEALDFMDKEIKIDIAKKTIKVLTSDKVKKTTKKGKK